MQKIEIYIRAESIKGMIVDAFNGATSRKVSVLRGMQVELILQLFKSADSSDDEAKYSADDLASFTTWKMYADVDYDLQTAPKLLVDAGGGEGGEGASGAAGAVVEKSFVGGRYSPERINR